MSASFDFCSNPCSTCSLSVVNLTSCNFLSTNHRSLLLICTIFSQNSAFHCGISALLVERQERHLAWKNLIQMTWSNLGLLPNIWSVKWQPELILVLCLKWALWYYFVNLFFVIVLIQLILHWNVFDRKLILLSVSFNSFLYHKILLENYMLNCFFSFRISYLHIVF